MAAIMTVRDRRAGWVCCGGLQCGAGSGGGRRAARCGRISWLGPTRNSPNSGTGWFRAGETGAPAGDVGAASGNIGEAAEPIGLGVPSGLVAPIGIAEPALPIGAADGTGALPSAADEAIAASPARPDVEIGPAVTPKDVRPDEAGGAGP
jgi:hypothetical protein